MSKTPSTDTAKHLIMPGDVRAIQVVSLVEELGALGRGISFTTLAEKTGVEIDVLPPILKAAEMLGLVGNEGGDLSLTEEGLQFQGSPMDKVSILKDKLASIEPFHTAVDLASKGSTTAREVAETLGEQGIQWHFNPDRNELAVRNLLIHWVIRAGLLSYDGKDGKFQIASSEMSQSGEGNPG
ncbi:MAG: AAA-associated domain-containing protein [Thaumarchaeota archaeon]|nr:AAA-associated domain-containing protein [Nitrososphaerota archaeon]